MSRHGYYRVNPITTPATEAGWNRLKAAFAQLKKMGYSAGLTAASAKGRKDGNGVIWADSESARYAEDSGVLHLYFGQGEAVDGFDAKRIEAIGRIVVEVFTLHSVPWWWSGDAGMWIACNVGMNAADYQEAERVKAAKARCDAAMKDARAAREALQTALKMRLEYWTATTLPENASPDVAYYQDGERAYAREAAACRAALAAYQVTMSPALAALARLGTCCACGKEIAEDPCEKTVCGECQARSDGRAVATAAVA